YAGMGTTVVAAVLDGATLTFASVGDSRLYLFDGSDLRQLTRDDSWVALLRAEGADAESLSHHPMRHVLTSVVGARPELDVRAHAIELADGHTLLFSTDGLHETIGHDVLVRALRDSEDLDRTATVLLDAALAAGGRDNIS